MKITLNLKSTYGRTLAYPACDASRALADMCRQKTFTRRELHILENALGYDIETNSGLALGDVQ